MSSDISLDFFYLQLRLLLEMFVLYLCASVISRSCLLFECSEWKRLSSCFRHIYTPELWGCWEICPVILMMDDLRLWQTPLFWFEGKPKQKVMGKAVKTPCLSWMEALPPPPPVGELEPCEQNEQLPEHDNMDIGWVQFHCSVTNCRLSHLTVVFKNGFKCVIMFESLLCFKEDN